MWRIVNRCGDNIFSVKFQLKSYHCPDINNDDKKIQRTVVRVIVYSKEYVKTYEVKDLIFAV